MTFVEIEQRPQISTLWAVRYSHSHDITSQYALHYAAQKGRGNKHHRQVRPTHANLTQYQHQNSGLLGLCRLYIFKNFELEDSTVALEKW